MKPDREAEKQAILEMIDRYLTGKATAGEAAGWATLKMTEEKPTEKESTVDDSIIAHGLGTLMMLSESEPQEYRTTREQLLQSRSHLLGEEPLPPGPIFTGD